MQKHHDFDLWLHDDGELSNIQRMDVVSRETLQEWPLSVVERVTFDHGLSRIYKASYNLPTEADFYRSVRSQYIPEVFFCHSDGERHWMLLEDVEGQHPASLGRDEMLTLAHGARKIICGLGSFEPYRYDLSVAGYDSFVDSTIGLLHKLRRKKKLTEVDAAAIRRIQEALSHPKVLRAVQGRCAPLHGDLRCKNMLIRPTGEMVIFDWQNILFGPEDIDLYTLMAEHDHDYMSIAGIGPEILRMALEIRWFADCLDRWMPAAAGFLGGRIADIACYVRHIAGKEGYAGGDVYHFG